MAADSAITKISKDSSAVSALQVGPSLFDKRIEFHLATKPFNAFSNGAASFYLETLNPSTSNSGNKQVTNVKKLDTSEVSQNGLDPELSFGISFKRIGAGLANLGNTCFLNSVLQCLTYTEPLAAYLQSGKHQSSCRIAGFCALCAVQKHVNNALRLTGRILAPKEIVSNLRCISRNFRNARQEDAHEYMVNLLESMHKCCLPSGIPSESPSAYDKSSVHKIFGGRLRSQVKCMQCSYSSDKFDPFLDLSLEIVKADSLSKALGHFTAKELLDGGERHYQCQQCKQKVKALKQLTIHKAPYVLTIHLKRFGSHIAGQKIDKKIHFGTTLDLKPFVTDPHDGDLKYTLYGVLVHAGWSTHSGHYYCFVRTSSGMWYSLDDYQVVQVSEKRVLEQKAYMLFYYRDRRNSSSKKTLDVIQNQNINSIEKAKAYSNSSNGLNETFRCRQNGSRVDVTFSSVKGAESNLLNATVPGPTIMKIAPCQNVTGLAATECSGPIIDSMLQFSTRSEGECLPQQDSFAKSSTSPLKADNSIVTERSANVVECSGETSVKGHANSLIDLPSSSRNILKPISSKAPGDPGIVSPNSNNHKNSQKVLDDTVAVSTVCCLNKESPLVTTETAKVSTQEDISCRPSDKISPVMTKSASTMNNSQAMESEVSTLPITKPISTQKNDHKEKSSLRGKRKILKCPPMKKHFTSKISFGTFLSVQKKKHKRSQKCKLVPTNLNQNDLVNGDSIPADFGPSTSLKYPKIPLGRLYKKSGSKKKEKSVVNNMVSSCDGNLIAENKMEPRERTGQNGAVLAVNNQSEKSSATASAGTGPGYSKDSKKEEVHKVLTRGLEETISVPRWDEREPDPIWKTNQSVPGKGSIGYVGDEWDEEYDRGKRKKVRNFEKDFSGPNPFQEIASKNTKLKKARLGYSSSGNKPFRI